MMRLEALLRAARDNEPGAWQRLVPSLQSALIGFCRQWLMPDEAAEIAQQAVTEVAEALPGLKRERSLQAWAFGIARSLVLHDERSRRRRLARHEAAALLSVLHTGLSTRYGEAEVWAILVEELERLPPLYRAVIEFDLEEGDPEAFATQQGISRATLRTRRHRATRLLAERVFARLGEPFRAPEPSRTPSST